MDLSIDRHNVRGPVPALRGTYLGDSPQPILEEDVARLWEDLGLTCIRYGFMASWLSDEEQETYHEAGMQHLQDLLDWCAKYDVHCVLDLHNALGRRGGGDPRLWREEYFKQRFVALWERIVARFRDHPAVAAWELINEPEPPGDDTEVWNALYQRTLEAVRKLDPDRAVIVDSVGYAKPRHFAGLALANDDKIVYSFHNYQPGPYHAQKRREYKDQSTYYYPGFIPHVRPSGQALDFEVAHYEPSEGKVWNRKDLLQEFDEVFRFRDRHGVPIFCGEFGCVSDVPEMTDMVYLMDEISIFQEQGFHWTLYNTMYRTDDPYWKTHFDCGLYIYYSPEDTLYRFERKIALMEFFCRNEGDVLRLEQPDDAWVGVYGVRRPDRSVALLVSNKHREESRDVTLRLNDLPERWAADVKTMARGDEGFVPQGAKRVDGGALPLHLGPLTLALVTIAAPAQENWQFDLVQRHTG